MMNYKKALENIVLKRKEQLAEAAQVYATAIKSDARLYSIELEIRRLTLSEIYDDQKKSPNLQKLEKEKKEALAALGITTKVLAPPPACKKCGDSGLISGKFCECVKREAIISDDSIGLPVRLFSQSDPKIVEESGQNTLYALMRTFCNKFPNTNAKNIILLGSTGTGKTYLASCIAGEIIDLGYSVVFLTAFAILQKMLSYHTSFDAGKDDYLRPLLDCDMLIIDDLGTESILKNVTLEYLYIIINERTIKGRHTLITTNLSMADMALRYGEKLVSRLFDKRLCLSKVLDGKDLRKSI